MVNNLEAIKKLKYEKERRQREFEVEMAELEVAISILGEMNEACPFCDGVGKKLRSRACAEDDRPDPDDPRDWNTCKACGGTGFAVKEAPSMRPEFRKDLAEKYRNLYHF